MAPYGPSLLLQYARMYGNRFFHQFGLHCATHQIRILLVSSVVITSLLYPAIALYSSSRPEFLSILDVTRSKHAHDLVDVWAGHESLRVLEDAVSLARTRASFLIQSSVEGAFNHQILRSTLACLKNADGSCFVLSPLAFWHYNSDVLLNDLSTRNCPQMPGTDFDYAMFLALTYFFPNSDCLGNAEHLAWLQAVDTASQGAPRHRPKSQEPTLIALEYLGSPSQPKGWTAISALIYLAYAAFAIYVTWSMRHMDAVHSRIGITFTAMVEIAVSTVTSISVCALVGFKVTMVPWELLPIVIVFVGAENMFNLVDAVGKTSVTLSVKQRIAQGLGHAGTSNTLKVVSYNSITGSGAIRQFCVFAVVVLVAHWFLAHTFFMAVLSIDIQRLELDDLLRQNTSLAPAVPPVVKEVTSKRPRSPKEKLALLTQNLLHGRATKNISLLMLLAITGTLYYTIHPTVTRPVEDTRLHAVLRDKNSTSLALQKPDTPAWNVWKTLNPNETPLHLRIEEPTIITFHSDQTSQTATAHGSYRTRTSVRTLRSLYWMFKIVVLPITITTVVLWGLLLYLLKDADLLEAQRNRPDSDSPEAAEEDQNAFEGRISFSTLPRAFSIEDGQVVVSVGMQNEVIVWRMPSRMHVSIDATAVLLRSASTSNASSTITCVAVDPDGGYFAVGTGAGVIAVWSISKDCVHPLPLFSLERSSSGVVDLHFLSTSARGHRRSPPLSEMSSSTERQPPLSLLAVYENGLAAKWGVGLDGSVTYFGPSQRASLVKALLLRVPQEETAVVAFCMDDGTLELVEVQGLHPQSLVCEQSICAGNPTDLVSKVHACVVEVAGGNTRFVLAAATESGTISLWDAVTGDLIHLLDEAHGRINHLRVSPVASVICRTCGKLPLDGFLLAFSVDKTVHFFRTYITDQARRCSCNVKVPKRAPSYDSLGRRSRPPTAVSTPGASPLLAHTKLAAVSEISAFPVSGHGWHSRRASEKDAGRRGSDTLTVPILGDDHDLLGPLDWMRPSANHSVSCWQHVLVIRIADTVCERGGWDVSDRRVIGVRRRPRSTAAKNGGVGPGVSQSGLTTATLERWEVWSFDPSGTRVQSSTLAALLGTTTDPPSRKSSDSTRTVTSSRDTTIPRLPFTRVSPFLMMGSHSVAGFGNTVGVLDFIPA
ncbi:sterol regulatory element binding protein cleavage-activating protein [Roridomyces roridus]|uniref:Sterol regulatory element-binding protein cleavage-activating protein n=1 Tax=Roridomyces roridus TaxID=1738132 RepID=A0AAD7B6I7_9AGAR|nr:sterol regulatory element binding protein cleavage-activating protein [Roridomyces roridus]